MIHPEQLHLLLEEIKPYVTEACEVSLADWQDNPNSGAWVKFRLPDETHLEIYRGKNRAGRTQKFGQRYHMILIEIGDDEMPLPAEAPPARPRKLSQIAGAICHDPEFRKWCELEYGEAVPDEPAAAALVREICGVDSRSFLDVNEEAGKVFREMLSDYDKTRHGA